MDTRATGAEDRMVAYCGIVCTDCDAYKATQTGNREALARMASQASKQLGVEMAADDVMCDGCLGFSGRQIPYCTVCTIRACGVENLVENCAHCADYACDRIEAFAPLGSGHRRTLDEIRTRHRHDEDELPRR